MLRGVSVGPPRHACPGARVVPSLLPCTQPAPAGPLLPFGEIGAWGQDPKLPHKVRGRAGRVLTPPEGCGREQAADGSVRLHLRSAESLTPPPAPDRKVTQALCLGSRGLGLPRAASRPLGNFIYCETRRGKGSWSQQSLLHHPLPGQNHPGMGPERDLLVLPRGARTCC